MPADPSQPKVVVVMPAYNAARTLVRTYRDIPGRRRPRHPGRRPVPRRHRGRGRAAEPPGGGPPPEPRLRRQPEDLLRHRPGRGRRRGRHAPPRLPVRRHPHPRAGRPHPGRRRRHGPGQPLPRRPAGRRHAPLEVRGQPVPHHPPEPRLRPAPVRVPHRHRAYSRLLETIDYRANSNDFVFDQELVGQVVRAGFRIAEVPVPGCAEASSVASAARSSTASPPSAPHSLRHRHRRAGPATQAERSVRRGFGAGSPGSGTWATQRIDWPKRGGGGAPGDARRDDQAVVEPDQGGVGRAWRPTGTAAHQARPPRRLTGRMTSGPGRRSRRRRGGCRGCSGAGGRASSKAPASDG